MSGNHGQGFVSAGARHRRPLVIALGLTSVYMLAEVAAGLIFDSLALLSDAGHMLTDVAGLGMALAAIQFAQGRRSSSHTYGLYRLEVLAALLNAFLLFAVAAYVLFEAYRRISDPPDVPGLPLMVVAAIGLAVNAVSFLLLRAGAKESLNVRGAFLEVLSDMLGSVGVLVAGVVLLTTGLAGADAIVGAGIGLFILPRAWRLGREALRILLEVAPPGLDVAELEQRLAALPGVSAVHDLHVWTITSGLQAATGHLRMTDGADVGDVLRSAGELLEQDYDVRHVTLQCEPPGFQEPQPEV